MADTLQAVLWSLERKCIFRSGNDWFLPRSAFRQLGSLREIAEACSHNRIIDGICVTGVTSVPDCSGRCHNIPVSGFQLAEPVGIGIQGEMSEVLSTCNHCEANAADKFGVKVAGCHGHLSIWPDSSEFDEQLWAIVGRRNLESRLRSEFHVTTPLWYGFWIESPLKRPQVALLYELLGAACGQSARLDRDLVHFVNALGIAVEWELPIHVSIGPPGHTDFGVYTVFPHCPRCKAEASVDRWQDKYPEVPIQCRVCGHSFNPNEHRSTREDKDDRRDESLERKLGKLRYYSFVERFLLLRGKTRRQTEEVIDRMQNGPLLRRIAETRKKREATFRALKIERAPWSTAELSPSIALRLTDDLALDLVLIPAGEFLMGAPHSSGGWAETPQHAVRFASPFYIGRFPVTQAQWAAVMGINPSWYKGVPELPVDRVSWFDCQEFCDILSHCLHRVIRLPSEAEWEYACRAGTTTKFAFGDVISPGEANFLPQDNHPLFMGSLDSEGDGPEQGEAAGTGGPRRAKTTPVGTYPPNAWGVYDMHGNVNEWCEDAWHDNYKGAPVDGSAWLDGEDMQPSRVVRGGWCSGTESTCESAARRLLMADGGAPDRRSKGDENSERQTAMPLLVFDIAFTPYGFRVVCEAD